MTFNIRYGTANDGVNSWPNRSALVIDVVRDRSPDILGLQEALRFQLDEMRTALPHYGEIGVGRDDGREAGEYAAILYRSDRFEMEESGTFWLSDTPRIPGSKSWGNRITRICTWARLASIETSERFYVFNLHLDHESQSSRERSVELLARRITEHADNDPVVVLGDFNAGEDNPAIRFLLGELAATDAGWSYPSPHLRDTYRTRYPTAGEDVGTFNAFRGESSGEQIDWILVSEHWDVLEAAIVRTHYDGRYPSDHFPVTALIRHR